MSDMSMRAKAVAVRGGTVLAGAALLATAMWLRAAKPHVEADALDPIRTAGRAGEVVRNPAFSLRVESVEAARSIVPGDSLLRREELRTEGIFVIVRARGSAAREPTRLAAPKLETTDGRTYGSGPRTALTAALGMSLQPLIWTSGTFVFEVPRDRLAGARLVVRTSVLLSQLSAETAVDLRIDARRAAELIARAPQRYELRTSRG